MNAYDNFQVNHGVEYNLIYLHYREKIAAEAASLADSVNTEDPFSFIKLIVAAMIYYYEENIEAGLKVLHASNNIEW